MAKQKDHGLSGTRQYNAWNSARNRVTNPNHPKWSDYGGRGIAMCQDWIDSFNAFWRDMGPTYQEGLTLDREDTNGNYCPENCRWAVRPVQSHNKRKRRGSSSEYMGVCFNRREGKYISYIDYKYKHEHLGYFASEIDAATAYDNKSEELYGDRPNGTIR